MYREDPVYVKKMLDSIKATAMLRRKLKEAVGADSVERLPNLGREGGTYLKHIVDKWDTLAEQTMFIQGHAHNMRELIPRINDYLVPETGMLSLGFAGVQCECERCADRWDWEDRYNAVPQLFEKIYNEPCDPKAPITLSYKGQFVVDTITSEEGWSHNETFVGDYEDRPDNPYFGFTVERIWSLLMQCATDERIAAKCPSLLSGMGWGGDVGDCQCLDR